MPQDFPTDLTSKQSSLGFYVTKNTYRGEHGLSLRVEGLEPGFNDKAYRRAIVIHGANYIGKDLREEVMAALPCRKKKAKRSLIRLKTEPVYLFTILKRNTCKAQKY